MTTSKRFLDQVYGLDGPDATRRLYDAWSDSYDREVAANGYATPQRCAAALGRCVSDRTAPVLDIGCGTGLSGEALLEAGFATLDGTDLSPEMIEHARAKDIYRDLFVTTPEDPVPFEPGTYAHIAAVGVFSPGHAPATLIDEALAKLPSEGCFVFSLNDHAMADPSYEGRIREWTDCGSAWIEVKRYGRHLPEIDLKSTVYVLRKA